MKPLIQLADLMRRRPPPAAEAPEDERVLLLFKNRAELKKAYSELQDEVHRLKDRIKQQEGATARVQEMLGGLETRLGLVETAYPALVFYQLRALWQSGREILERFVAVLARQQEERERRAFLAQCNRRLFVRRRSVEDGLRAAETELAHERQRESELAHERAKLTRFWHFFKRRQTEHRLSLARTAASAAEQRLVQARAAAEQLLAEATPQFPGLSIQARRAINLAAIAYAEVLCWRLAETPIVALAREATARREAADNYGDRDACEALIASIDRARVSLSAKDNLAREVQARAERLKSIAHYRDPADTTPVPESIAFFEGDALAGQPLGDKRAARMPNVLAEDTWDLYRVLLR